MATKQAAPAELDRLKCSNAVRSLLNVVAITEPKDLPAVFQELRDAVEDLAAMRSVVECNCVDKLQKLLHETDGGKEELDLLYSLAPADPHKPTPKPQMHIALRRTDGGRGRIKRKLTPNYCPFCGWRMRKLS